MNYEQILTDAYAAATAGILAHFKAGKQEHPFNCGFAWVQIDGTDALARYCRKQIKVNGGPQKRENRKYGDKGYPSGWQFWAPGEWPSAEEAGVPTIYGQDMDFKRAGAEAFQKELAKHGIVATVGTRLD